MAQPNLLQPEDPFKKKKPPVTTIPQPGDPNYKDPKMYYPPDGGLPNIKAEFLTPEQKAAQKNVTLSDTSTLAGRYAAANIIPGNQIMPANVNPALQQQAQQQNGTTANASSVSQDIALQMATEQVNASTPSIEQMQAQYAQNQAQSLATSQANNPNTLGKMGVMNYIGSGQAVADVGVFIAPKAADLYDKVTDLVSPFFGGSTKKSKRVTMAEQAFTDASGVIDLNIDLVKSGQMKGSVALRDFDMALAAIDRLDKEVQAGGVKDLNYWRDEGASIQAQIVRERAVLRNQRLKLIAADIAQQQNAILTGQ